ncbi:MAG: YibE/F family protein, partial [Desulfobacterales bacterium]|nr:YibE/F family protein [Desulfobacterales bacterium]
MDGLPGPTNNMIKNKRYVPVVIFCLILAGGFYFWGSQDDRNHRNTILETPGTVISVDNTGLQGRGLATLGVQELEVVLTGGPFKGSRVNADNHMMGQWDLDELYGKGDHILLAVQVEDGKVGARAKAINTYRQNWELILFGVFAVLLVAYAGTIGVKALVSFMAVLLIIWFFYLPGLLKGTHPLVLSIWMLMFLSGVIVFSVAGFTRKGLTAFLGTLCGLFVTLGLTVFFGEMLKLGGMTSPFASTLILTGQFRLDMQ